MTENGEGDQVSRATTDRGQTTTSVLTPNKARAGEVVLGRPRQRLIFFAAILGALIVAALIALAIY